MTRKHLAERRQRLRELAERDLANRCPVCKLAISRRGWVSGADLRQRFCSWACRQDAEGR